MNWNRFNPISLFARRQFPALRISPQPAALCCFGMSLLELVVACAILLILATASIPLARNTIKWRKRKSCVGICGRCATR